MKLNNFTKKYSAYTEYFNEETKKYIESLPGFPKKLKDAVEYSLFAGGKRIRPVLLFAFNESLGGKKEDVLPFAIAIECIHTYSLIHDDLPSMDNDDFRRGKPSSHKKFGEAIAILTGDALLNLAYETIFNKKELSLSDIKASKIISNYSGFSGMIAGQVYDIDKPENDDIIGIDDIVYNKTAKLITAPILVASVKNGDAFYHDLLKLGFSLGRLFQITDDILDYEGDFNIIGKTPGKDKDKYTYINQLGIVKTKELANEEYINCKTIVEKLPNNSFLLYLIELIYSRNK